MLVLTVNVDYVRIELIVCTRRFYSFVDALLEENYIHDGLCYTRRDM